MGRDHVDRERRALEDQHQQRIGIERDRGDQNVELLRRKEIRLGGDFVGRRLLACYCRLLRCGPGCGRLLRLGRNARTANHNKYGASERRQPLPSRSLPPFHRCPPCGQRFGELITLRSADQRFPRVDATNPHPSPARAC
jgi:hypothetical protein